MSGRSAALVKGQRPVSNSTARQVARPITWPEQGRAKRPGVACVWRMRGVGAHSWLAARTRGPQSRHAPHTPSAAVVSSSQQQPATGSRACVPTCWADGWVDHGLQRDGVQHTCVRRCRGGGGGVVAIASGHGRHTVLPSSRHAPRSRCARVRVRARACVHLQHSLASTRRRTHAAHLAAGLRLRRGWAARPPLCSACGSAHAG
jgi:hypothetical protein